MITGIYTSTAGMLIQEREQEVIANNIANANTVGFKRAIAVFQEKPVDEIVRLEKSDQNYPYYPHLKEEIIGKTGKGVLVEKTVQDLQEGAIRQTGNRLDFAISGAGYFAVEGPQKKVFFTRAGNFTVNQNGELVTQQGYRVLGVAGGNYEEGMPVIDKKGEVIFPLEPIELGNGLDGKVTVDTEGRIYVGNDYTGIDLKTFNIKEENLIPYGQNLFSSYGEVTYNGKSNVLQGYLEMSNVNSVKELVRMIQGMRTYEFNQKLIRTQDETLGKLISRISMR